MNSLTDTGGGGSLQAEMPQTAIRQVVTRTILISGETSYKTELQATDSRNGANHSIGYRGNIVGEFAIQRSTFGDLLRYLN
jgi:hypothetical protein